VLFDPLDGGLDKLGSPRACAQVPPIQQRHSLHIQQQTLQAHLHFSVRKRAVSPRIWDFCNKIGTFWTWPAELTMSVP